jgi:CARDB
MTRTKALQKVGRLAGALLTAAGLALSAGCGLDVVGTLTCDISNVQVTGTPTRHKYAFDFICSHIDYNGTVKGAYDTESKRVEEKVANANGTLTATWTCPSDPWLFDRVRCQRGQVQANYKNAGQYPQDLPFNTYGSFKLLEHHRVLLRGKVADLKPPAPPQTPPEAPKAPPAPPKPTKPDLVAVRVTGNTQPFDGVNGVYEVVVRNDGTRPQGPVELVITFGGTMEEAGFVDATNGFDCTGRGTVTCTGVLGGDSDAIQDRVAIVRMRGWAKAKGAGSITAAIDPQNRVGESNEGNNTQALAVTVK